MNSFVNVFVLILIPVLVSLSWLLGGNLVRELHPITLASTRVVLSAVALFSVSSIIASQRDWTWTQRKSWWKDQVLLSVTGRILYVYLSASALLTISPFEAVLITTQLPIISMFFERIFGLRRFSSFVVPILAVITCLIAALTLWSTDFQSHFSFKTGHIQMLLAMLFYGVHLVFYKQKVRDKSSINPLFSQFFIASLALLPLGVSHMNELGALDFADWGQLFVYTLFGGVFLFVLTHHSLKRFTPFAIASVSILSPIFAILFKNVHTDQVLSTSFIFFTILTCLLTFLTLRVDTRFVERKEAI